MITISERTEYVAAHLRPRTKKRLKAASVKSHQSVSEIISDAVERELRRRDRLKRNRR